MQAERTQPRRGAHCVVTGKTVGFASLLTLAAGLSCSAEPLTIFGQYGRPMALASGDGSPLPRLAFIDHGCPGESAAGSCSDAGDGACQTLLIDTLAPLTTIADPDATGSRISTECLEVRPAEGLLADPPPPQQVLDNAVARFRFDNLPVVRTTEGAADDSWSWTAGDQDHAVQPRGVLGGNLLRTMAVAIRTPPGSTDPPSMDMGMNPMGRRDRAEVSLFAEFPGSESILADQGLAFLPLQFPGRLLGRELPDRCDVDEGRCEIDGFDVSTSSSEIPLLSSLMVMDACMAIPPCGLEYERSMIDPFAHGTCSLQRGPSSPPCGGDNCCDDPTNPEVGGLSASLVVATGLPGLVLFSDSATRMFGDLSQLEPCPEEGSDFSAAFRACLLAEDGQLHLAGWPSAGVDGAPLTRLLVRSLALVPGADRSTGVGPCQRAGRRREVMLRQCDRYEQTARTRGDIRDAAPPYSSQLDGQDGEDHADDPGATSLAVLGEAMLEFGAEAPRPDRWIPTLVLPAEHPVVQAVRRTAAPTALEPDGLLGTALLADNITVLDYTDLNPAVRLGCLHPHDGDCQVLPDCREDQRAACCHGLPLSLLEEFIVTLDDDTCCGALSAEELAELAPTGHCLGVAPP